MPDAFDPYHTWLGIPPRQQPPNHYRLLGIPLLEENPDAIAHAADQRMAHLRTLQTGKHGELSQKLLNEVAAARVCLLSSARKAAYDRRLRQALQAEMNDDAGPGHGGGADPRLAGQTRMAVPPGPARRKPAGIAAGLDRLGEYRLLEKLGEGGMGAVYKALHTKLDRTVALKVLPGGRLESQEAIARFEREMKAVGAVDHPNIVRAMDAREVAGTRFLVMEYVEGQNLNEVVRHCGPLSVADACELIRQTALGLQSAHEHGLVHRDIKPLNLMLTPEGQVKILDLGLARFQADQPAGEEMTATGLALGTPDYMAPEQVSDSRTADIRADIYGLGCTLFKLLTGQPPFSGAKYQSALAKMTAHLQEPAPRIRRLRNEVPKELARLVDRMLAKDPADRFATPAKVADAIGSFAVGSDLRALSARAEGRPAPVARAEQSLVATEQSASAGLTRFLQRVKTEQRKPGVQAAAAEGGGRAKLAIFASFLAVAIFSLLILVFWAVMSRSGPSREAVLVLDWPEDQRQDVSLRIDRTVASFPSAAGPLEYGCKPGRHRIVATRPGFEPYDEVFTVEAGARKEISPVWKSLEEESPSAETGPWSRPALALPVAPRPPAADAH